MKKLASSLALVCSAVLATSAAQAAQTSHFRASANFLIGNFNNFVDSCQVLSADVIYGGQVIQTSGAPMSMPVLIVEARYVDGCNGIDMTLDGFTETIQSVSIRGDQGAATLVAEVPVSDGNGTTILMSINLTFTANGDPTTA